MLVSWKNGASANMPEERSTMTRCPRGDAALQGGRRMMVEIPTSNSLFRGKWADEAVQGNYRPLQNRIAPFGFLSQLNGAQR
jgi:hypothetical protein